MADFSGQGIFLFVVIVLVYFLPFLTAEVRQHPQRMAILTLNLLLGWTFVCWVLALVWSQTTPGARIPAPTLPALASPAAALFPAPEPAWREWSRILLLILGTFAVATVLVTLIGRAVYVY